ncbi:MAG: DNA recombination/repair protein RecA, partial [Bacteroidota bacterium]
MEKKEINKEKLKSLELAVSVIEKNFGKGAIMKMGTT